MLREIYFVEAACSYSINWVLFWLFLVCFVFLFCFVCLYVCLFCHKHQAWRFEGVSMIPMLILFVFSFSFFFFETDETATFDSFGPHRNQVFGTWDRYPHDCDEKRGGGWWYSDSNCAVWSNLNGLYFDNKTSRAIYWSKLSTVPEESIPRSAEMKIRPVDFFSSFSRYTDWKAIFLFCYCRPFIGQKIPFIGLIQLPYIH